MTANTQPARSETIADDLELVHASKSGDVAAFEELVKRYDRKVFRIAYHLTQNREDAQDVAQEAFLRAFQFLGQFQENAKFSTWLIRIAMNQALMMLRKRRPMVASLSEGNGATEEEQLPIDVADWAPNPEELYRATELEEILRKTLQELGMGLKMVFVLRDIEGLSLEQTAEVLEITLTAVKARSRRARLQLRERLTKYFNQSQDLAGIEHGLRQVAGR